MMKRFLTKLLKNKVFLYMISRYATYALQFITTLMIAVKLGPTDFGIWSFVLLVVGFFNIIDFGIANSINVILVHDKENEELCAKHIKSVIIINAVISIIVLLLFIAVSFIDVPLLEKYHADLYYIYILLIVVFFYFNKSFASIYRVKNRLLEVALYQSTAPVLLFLSVILISGPALINYLVGSYVVGYFIVLLIFILGEPVVVHGRLSIADIRYVSGKGFWLFMYNSAFYLILYLTSVFVSAYYTVDEFGKFNFSVTLSNAIVLLIDAFGFIIFPKMIDRFSGKDFPEVQRVIDSVRLNYTTLVCLLIYIALPFFYIFPLVINKYEDTGLSLCFAALSFMPYTAAFGINTFLIAQNQEKKLSVVSTICLLFSICSSLIFIKVFHTAYSLAFISILFSYALYTTLCSFCQFKYMGKKMSVLDHVLYVFPIRQLVPFVLAVVAVYFSFTLKKPVFLFIPLFLFIFMNYSQLKEVGRSIKSVVYHPNIVDL